MAHVIAKVYVRMPKVKSLLEKIHVDLFNSLILLILELFAEGEWRIVEMLNLSQLYRKVLRS